MAGSCKYGDERAGSGATALVGGGGVEYIQLS
jgi:hypothetical protein